MSDITTITDELATKISDSIANAQKNINFNVDSEKSAKAEESKKAFEIMKKALNEGTGNAGGFVVPVEYATEVYRTVQSYSQMRGLATVLPMSTSTMKIPAVTTAPTVYKVSELSAATASQPTFSQYTLTAEKYVGLTYWSNEVEEDTFVQNWSNYLAVQFGEQIAKKEQTDIISSATAGSEGFLTVSGVTNVDMAATKTTFADITWDNLADMLAQLEAISTVEAQNSTFVMHPTVFNYLRKSKASTGGEYFVLPAPQDNVVAQAWGRPIVLCNEMPSSTAISTKFVALADWKRHLIIGDNRALTATVSTEGSIGGSSLFEIDAKALRVAMRSAHVCVIPSGIVTLKTAAA